MNENKKPNKLINEKSPYLFNMLIILLIGIHGVMKLLKKLKEEDKPIFLSIGI